jgi:hypothetical protein
VSLAKLPGCCVEVNVPSAPGKGIA